MPRCKFLKSTDTNEANHTCDAGVCESVAECSAKTIHKNQHGKEIGVSVRYTKK